MIYFISSAVSLPPSIQDMIVNILSSFGIGYITLVHIQLYNIFPFLAIIPSIVIGIMIHFIIQSNKPTARIAMLHPLNSTPKPEFGEGRRISVQHGKQLLIEMASQNEKKIKLKGDSSSNISSISFDSSKSVTNLIDFNPLRSFPSPVTISNDCSSRYPSPLVSEDSSSIIIISSSTSSSLVDSYSSSSLSEYPSPLHSSAHTVSLPTPSATIIPSLSCSCSSSSLIDSSTKSSHSPLNASSIASRNLNLSSKISSCSSSTTYNSESFSIFSEEEEETFVSETRRLSSPITDGISLSTGNYSISSEDLKTD
jgi:hypothetical protein